MPNYKNIVGEKIGCFTAIEYRGNGKWLFRCKCGEERVYSPYTIRKGIVKSCGCSRNLPDITGARFGKLVALRQINHDRWLFKCDCGNEHEASLWHVKSGRTQSCGCKNKLDTKPTQDITGKRFGRLTVLKYVGDGNGLWLCHCDCGNDVKRNSYQLKRAQIPSCGCYVKEGNTIPFKHKQNNGSIYRNNRIIYQCWLGMRSRCYNPKNPMYRLYGGRGIKICDRWRNSFENFLADMGDKPSPHHSIDRIDSNKDYCPENCRWATIEQQNNNTRRNVLITYNGETKTLAQWCKEFGLDYQRTRHRYARGMNLEKVFSKEHRQKFKFNDEEVRIIRTSKEHWTELRTIIGDKLTYDSYRGIRIGEYYKNVK